MMRRPGCSRKREQGQALVGFALVLSLLLLLLLGIAEFAVVVLSYNTLADAARQGARYGMIHPGDALAIEAVARDATAWLDQDALTFAVDSDMTAQPASAQAEYDLSLISGVIIEAVGDNPLLHLHAISTMPIEY